MLNTIISVALNWLAGFLRELIKDARHEQLIRMDERAQATLQTRKAVADAQEDTLRRDLDDIRKRLRNAAR